MIYRILSNTKNESDVQIDVCIPCWELSAKLKTTINALTNGPSKLSVPAKLILNVEKQSVVKNRLACLAESRSKYVLWLDDDVVFEKTGWDSYLLEKIQGNADVGVIGIRVKHWQLLDRSPMRPSGFVEDVCGAVMMTRKIEGVNFDDNYVGSQWEDTDYCFSVRKAGYKVLQDNGIAVIHYNEEKNREYVNNRAYFNQKWGTQK